MTDKEIIDTAVPGKGDSRQIADQSSEAEPAGYVIVGELPPEVWQKLTGFFGFALGIKIVPLSQAHMARLALGQESQSDLPGTAKGETETSTVFNKADFYKFAEGNGFTKVLAGRAWNSLAKAYDRKVNRDNMYEYPYLEPLNFSGTVRDVSDIPKRYSDLELGGLKEITDRIEELSGDIGELSANQVNEWGNEIFPGQQVGKETFVFIKALTVGVSSPADNTRTSE